MKCLLDEECSTKNNETHIILRNIFAFLPNLKQLKNIKEHNFKIQIHLLKIFIEKL